MPRLRLIVHCVDSFRRRSGAISNAFDRSLTLSLAVSLALPLWHLLRALPARLSYPWELEWMEGGIVSHIRVVLAGEPLYRAPSLTFTPFIYPPVYYYVSAVLAKIVGVGYLAPRLVSVLSIVGCFGLLFYWVWRETQSALAGWVTVGLFTATYDLSGRWFDIARSDSLLLMLLLLACVLSRFGRGSRATIATGVILALAFFTKQSALSVALPVLLATLVRDRERSWLAALTFAGLLLVGVLALDSRSSGWFSYYAFEIPAHHLVAWESWREVIVQPIWPWVAPMVLASMAVVCGVPSLPGGARSWPAGGLFVLGACAGSAAALLHTGGFVNVLIPGLAAMSFATGIALAHLRRESGPLRLRLRVLTTALVLMQLGLLSFGATRAIPRSGDMQIGSRMVKELAAMPGPIWCTTSNEYPVLAGHPERTTHAMGLVDVFKAADQGAQIKLLQDLARDLASGRIRTIVLDRAAGFLPDAVVQLIHENYRLTARLMPTGDSRGFWPNTGAGVRPDEVWSFTPRNEIHAHRVVP